MQERAPFAANDGNVAIAADDSRVDLGRDCGLVERVQAGDPDAFEELYRRYFQRLVRFCHQRLGNRHDAEEVAQDAFTKAFASLDRLQGERRFYPWLTVIAGRMCVDALRRRQRSEPVAEPDTGVAPPSHDAAIVEIDRALIRTALGRLSPRHRDVLQLREAEGWTYETIAAHYDVTVRTVDSLLVRARRSLRREFEAIGGSGTVFGGIPVFGAALRRFRVWASRINPPAVELTAVAPAALSALVVISAAAGQLGASPDSVRAAPVPREVAVENTFLPEPLSPSPHPSSPAPNMDHPLPTDEAVPASQPVDLVDADEARDRSDSAPVKADVAGAYVGADPATAAADAAQKVERYVDDIVEVTE